MKTWIALIVLTSLLSAEAFSSLTIAVEKETPLYTEDIPVLAVVKADQYVLVVGGHGKWYTVRAKDDSGQIVEGFVSVDAFVLKPQNTARALQDASVYAPLRPVVATVPQGAELELLDVVDSGYLARYVGSEDQPVRGIMPEEAITKTDQVQAFRQERLRATRKEREFEALYEQWKNKYALVDGEYVRLPDFDLRYENSRGATPYPGKLTLPQRPQRVFGPTDFVGAREAEARLRRFEDRTRKWHDNVRRRKAEYAKRQETWHQALPAWSVGEFGSIEGRTLEILQILGPSQMLCLIESADKTVCMTGWSTEGLVDEEHLEFGFVAITGTYRYVTVLGAPRTVLHAIPMAGIREGLTKEQFRELLKEKGGPDKL